MENINSTIDDAYVVQMKVPDDMVEMAIRMVMDLNRRVESQNSLCSMVIEVLRLEDPDVHISANRIRRIAIDRNAARLEIEYRGSQRKDLPDICPVCGNAMSPTMNMTLDGNITEVTRDCTVCPYSVDKKIMVPGRYIFVRVPRKEVSEREVRIRKIKKAAALLRKASSLVSEAVDGTSFSQRKEYIEGSLNEILTSKDRAGSIPNLESDIRDMDREDPLWTRPTASPKYADRKDI